jgi:hypothetical protein
VNKEFEVEFREIGKKLGVTLDIRNKEGHLVGSFFGSDNENCIVRAKQDLKTRLELAEKTQSVYDFLLGEYPNP